MIESFLGTVTLCALLSCAILSIIQFISMRIGLKQYEDDVNYIGDYTLSIIVFLVTSMLLLNFYISIYYLFSSMYDSPIFNSGLLFLLLGLISGFTIKCLYKGIMKIIQLFDKSKNTYILKNYEMNWTMLFICLILCIYFIFGHYMNFALSYISIIISYFFWIDFSKENFKKKLKELKSLSVCYWCSLFFITICSFASIRYSKSINIIAAIIGIIIGFIIGIFCMYYISKKSKYKYISSTNLIE